MDLPENAFKHLPTTSEQPEDPIEGEEINCQYYRESMKHCTGLARNILVSWDLKRQKLIRDVKNGSRQSLVDWIRANESIESITIPDTFITELRLREKSRVVLKNIILTCIDILNDGYTVDIGGNKIYVETSTLHIMIANGLYKNLDDENFGSYLGALKSVVELFVPDHENRPKDVLHLIAYLEESVSKARQLFVPAVIVHHPSLYRSIHLSSLIDCLYGHLIDDCNLNLGVNSPLQKLISRYNFSMPFEDFLDITDPFWDDVLNNPRIHRSHKMLLTHTNANRNPINSNTITNLPPQLSFLVFVTHCLWHLGKPIQLGDNEYTKLEVDNYIFALHPTFMPEMMKMLIENDCPYGLC